MEAQYQPNIITNTITNNTTLRTVNCAQQLFSSMDFSECDSDLVRKWIASPSALSLSSSFFPVHKVGPTKKRKSPELREEFKNIDYSKTKWGLLIRNPLVTFPDNRHGKLFRRRFRLPFQLFEILVKICAEKNISEVKDISRVKIPIEIKLLCCLRVLGRDDCFDAIEEMSDVPEKVLQDVLDQLSEGVTV